MFVLYGDSDGDSHLYHYINTARFCC